jgi:hypothetical protein
VLPKPNGRELVDFQTDLLDTMASTSSRVLIRAIVITYSGSSGASSLEVRRPLPLRRGIVRG